MTNQSKQKNQEMPKEDATESMRVASSLFAQRQGLVFANDVLYQDLEARYGSGFAQWVIDRTKRDIG